jgi:4-amino-4-deoxy-L-arabinose transferase-like glycosyltransferase
VLAVALGASLLRLLLLPREALDGDEVFTRAVSVASFGDAWRELRYDLVHPPLYYLVLRAVVVLGGDSPLALRAPSLAMGLGLLLLAAWWVRHLTGSWRWGLLVVLLLALSPLQLHASQAARGYALYAFLVLAAVTLLDRALRQSAVTARWAAFSLAAGAALLTHYVAAIYLACTLPAVLRSPEARLSTRRWAASLAIPALALVAWLVALRPYYRAKGGLDVNMAWVESPAASDLAALYAGYAGVPDFARGTTLALLLSVAVAGLGLAALRAGAAANGGASRHGREGGRVAASEWALVAILALLPPAIIFALSQPPLSLPLWGERHVLPSHAFWVIAMVLLLREVAVRRRHLALALAIGLVVLQALALGPALARPLKVPYDRVAAFLMAEVRPGLPVLATSPHNVARPVSYYLRAPLVVDSFASVAQSPDDFWLLYRPRALLERARFDSLVAGGWEVRRSAHFGDAWGTTVVRIERR